MAATFQDTTNKAWVIRLDPPLVEKVKSLHGINLADLTRDPLQQCRNDPMTLAAVVAVCCERQRIELEIDAETFGRTLPFPGDQMIEALTEAIVDFFPTGRASHVRGVLAKYQEMATTEDQIVMNQIDGLINDPETKERLNSKARLEIDRALAELFPSSPLTVSSSRGMT